MSNCTTHHACDCITKKLLDYDKLESELAQANEKLAGNICGYCWDKMHDGEFDNLKAEYEKLRQAYNVLSDVVENSLKQCGSLHKPVYFLWLNDALAKADSILNEGKEK